MTLNMQYCLLHPCMMVVIINIDWVKSVFKQKSEQKRDKIFLAEMPNKKNAVQNKTHTQADNGKEF